MRLFGGGQRGSGSYPVGLRQRPGTVGGSSGPWPERVGKVVSIKQEETTLPVAIAAIQAFGSIGP